MFIQPVQWIWQNDFRLCLHHWLYIRFDLFRSVHHKQHHNNNNYNDNWNLCFSRNQRWYGWKLPNTKPRVHEISKCPMSFLWILSSFRLTSFDAKLDIEFHLQYTQYDYMYKHINEKQIYRDTYSHMNNLIEIQTFDT